MSTITPEQFMTQTTEPDEDVFEPDTVPSVDPLESIAESLRVVADSLTGQHDEALQAAREQYDDSEAKYADLYRLLADVEKLVAPSTSKLANGVREAIARWRNPVVEPEAVEPDPNLPAHDAPVEEWRLFARAHGHTVGEMNRSQIRTLLGIEQPAAVDGGAE